MTEAEKTSILEWMDKQIELHEALVDTQDYSDDISTCLGLDAGKIYMYRGLGALSEATGKNITQENVGRTGYYHRFVLYKGCKFYTQHEMTEQEKKELCI